MKPIYEMTFLCSQKVNFEDVDAGGGVYHPNYLNYLERGRSQTLRDLGYSFSEMLRSGFAFVVAENHSFYRKPAFLEDDLVIATRIAGIGKSSIKCVQAIFRGEAPSDTSTIPNLLDHKEAVHAAQMRLVCVDLRRKVSAEFPPEFKSRLGLVNDQVPLEFSKTNLICSVKSE